MNFAVSGPAALEAQEGRYFVIVQNSQAARVICRHPHPTAALAHARRVYPREQHHPGRIRGGCLQSEVVNFPHHLQRMKNRPGRKSGVFFVLAAACLGMFLCEYVPKGGYVVRRDVIGAPAPKLGKNVHVQKLAHLAGTNAVFFRPSPVVFSQFSKGYFLQLCPAGQALFFNARGFRHGAFLAQRLGACAGTDILFYLPQQGHGLGNRPTVRRPPQRFVDTLSAAGTIADRQASVRDTAVFPGRVFSVEYPFFSWYGVPLVLGGLVFASVVFRVTHMSPTFLVLTGINGQSVTPHSLENQSIKLYRATLGIGRGFLLSCRPQVRFLSGAPENSAS